MCRKSMVVGPHRRSRGGGRGAGRGFTLIEILMVVVILGIASAVIVPQIGTRDDLKVAAAARIVMADLIYAQNRSIATQQMHCVEMDADAERYGLVTLADPDTYITHPINKDDFVVRFGSTPGLEGVTVTSADFDDQTSLGFDELGTPYAIGESGPEALTAAGTIVLTSGSHSLTISIEPFTGEISLP
jgi:prepilin-type N-terminal cleavage/methylation domain-containing protein